ncbi:MAG TPA: NADP-dependent phosphogluconate dehydrogenase [Afifellaceae bacterium]|nr:NADP-dependent phosphogluconate dehydrogenase [Afifellaceae bacterium]
MDQADIGLIGLAVMGRNLVLNMADNGYRVAVYNRTYERTTSLLADAGPLADRLIGCETLDELVSAIRPPRPVALMVQAGAPVDEQIEALTPLLSDSDIIMDCGNANYHDTVRRFRALEPTGLVFMGVGVSGGEEGARYGPAIMAGGTLQGYDRVADILKKIAAKYEGDPCAAYLGSDGAGHFVKTIHNGIEYADMQMIAEIYSIMRHALMLSPAEMSDIFARWNEGPLESYLIEITAKILRTFDPDTGKPMVDVILDRAGQKGTGRWAAIEALDLGIPATTLESAVAARALSSFKDQRLSAAELYRLDIAPPQINDRAAAIDGLERALLAGKICAYAQGFAIMAAASESAGWQILLNEVARIWRAGCIIRSRFLNVISSAYEANPGLTNLLVEPSFVAMMTDSQQDLRSVIALAAETGIPAPSLSSALAYFDSYRTGRLPANLIQAQRDFFGAHGFERTDKEGDGFHGPWGLEAG